jgi:ketosteroid isomerase-like protein
MYRSLLFIVVALTLITPPATAAAQSAEVTKTLQQRYSDWMNAFRKRDGATMDRMEAQGLTLIFPDGRIWTKAKSRVDELSGQPPLVMPHTLEQVVSRVHGDVAVLTAVQNDTDTKTGARTQAAFTSVWKREGGEWKIWSGHWSEVPLKK